MTAAEAAPAKLKPVRRGDIALGMATILACGPALLGVAGAVLPTLIHPYGMAMETRWQIFLVDLFSWSTVVALLSPVTTIIGIVLALWTVRRIGWQATLSKVVVGLVVGAILSTLGGAAWMYTALHREPDPRAISPIASLPAPIRALHDACESGDASACSRLAGKYQSADGVPRSRTLSARYYERGCDWNDSNACMNGGTMYLYGRADPPADPERALRLLQRACDQNHPLGCLKVGIVHAQGLVTEANPKTAAEYFGRACNLGVSDGCKWAHKLQQPP